MTLEKKIYTHEEAMKESQNYFGGDEMAARTWVSKYALKDSKDNIYELSPVDMHKRLASEISRIENKYSNPLSEKEIYDLIDGFKYIIPQGGPMTGVGNPYQVSSLSNCFVIGNRGDSYGAIMRVDEEQVQLMKRRGGVGHDLSGLRPNKSPTNNSALTSTGVVPFMERYSNSTREVAQDGRRGALMLSIAIRHPDSEAFIDAKMTPDKINGANVSVKIDDEFMKAVKEDKMYTLKFPVDSENPSIKREIKAKNLWNKIIHNAWKSAEPGILFWDTIIKESIPDCYADLGYKSVSTNPCGEIPLCPYDSCRLLSMNLYSYVENPFTPNAKFNFDKFKEHVHYAQRISDDIIDLEVEKIEAIHKKILKDPEDEDIKRTEIDLWKKIKEKAVEGRRMGLGVTAEGDMLAALGLKYGSQKATKFSVEVHKTLALEAYRSSVNLAKERGAFKIYDKNREENNPFINRIKENDSELYNEMIKYGRRNIALLTIAPTGTTSMMTQTTSGIEPVFLPTYKRRRKVNPNDKNVKITFTDNVGDSWEEYNVFHPKFEEWLKVNGYNVNEVKNYDEEKMNEILKKSPYEGATSNDVDWVAKVKMQGEIQKWVDHSISVTVNLPENATEEIVSKVYETAWEAGCKGVTVYREGSRDGVLVSNKKENKLEKKVSGFPAKRPKDLDAEVIRFKNVGKNGDLEDWIAFVGLYEGKPYEIFTGKLDEEFLAVPKSITKGKIVKEKNGDTHYDFHYETKRKRTNVISGISDQFEKEFWNYARLISYILQRGDEVEEVVRIVSKLEDTDGIHSWKAGVNRALKKYIPDGTTSKDICPKCNMNFHYESGCKTCGCGSSCD